LQPKSQPDDFEKFTINNDDEEDVFKRALTGSFLPAIAVVCQDQSLVNEVIEAEHGFTLLHAASYHSNVKAVKTLLSLGADPNQQDYRQQTPLHIAIRFNYCHEIVWLLSKRTNKALFDDSLCTPGLLAAMCGRPEAYQLLKTKGEQSSDINGNTELHLASAMGHTSIA
jgi:ankyrin repeat protein